MVQLSFVFDWSIFVAVTFSPYSFIFFCWCLWRFLFDMLIFIHKRKRYVYVVHCPEAQNFGVPLTIDYTGTYVRPEGKGGMFLCGRSPDAVSIV